MRLHFLRRTFLLCAAVVAASTVTAATAAKASSQDTTRARPSEAAPGDTIPVYVLEPLNVRGRIADLSGLASSASVGFVGFRDLRLRPIAREGEVLESVPGMILTQHSGSGKSNQMFVRGFNLDHGTDFSTRVEGMPVNIPTHAHGQGYTDLNFIIPELVDHVEYSLGGYYAAIGDFGSAGGAQIRLRRTLERPLFTVGIGENGFRRVVAATPAAIGTHGSLLIGGVYKAFDGPWERPEDLQKLSGMARYVWQGSTTNVSLLALGYDNRWNSSDQIPLRGVESGLFSRFGQVDPTLGGESSRYSVSAIWNRSSGRSSQHLDLYAVNYAVDLFSNFTYLLDNEDAGDQIRQRDRDRLTLGANVAHTEPVRWGGLDHTLTAGAQVRSDRADVSLLRTRMRETLRMVRRDDVSQWNAGAYGELQSVWSPVLRTVVGLRADVHRFDVDSDREENSGNAGESMLSPKLSLAFGPWSGTELYMSGGFSFHSNDARGAVQTVDPESGDPLSPVTPLVRSRGAEVGVRSAPVDGLHSTFSLWTIVLDSELLFVGDAGTTEAKGASRRIGVTFTNFYRIRPTWIADVDVSFTRARFLDAPPEGDRIPNALENVIAAGLVHEPPQDGVFMALRLRRFGRYPLTMDSSERGNANQLLNLNLGYSLGDARLTVTILNLLDEEHSDIQYFYGSRLSREPAGGVQDLHFHPAEPRQMRVSLSWGM